MGSWHDSRRNAALRADTDLLVEVRLPALLADSTTENEVVVGNGTMALRALWPFGGGLRMSLQG